MAKAPVNADFLSWMAFARKKESNGNAMDRENKNVRYYKAKTRPEYEISTVGQKCKTEDEGINKWTKTKVSQFLIPRGCAPYQIIELTSFSCGQDTKSIHIAAICSVGFCVLCDRCLKRQCIDCKCEQTNGYD